MVIGKGAARDERGAQLASSVREEFLRPADAGEGDDARPAQRAPPTGTRRARSTGVAPSRGAMPASSSPISTTASARASAAGDGLAQRPRRDDAAIAEAIGAIDDQQRQILGQAPGSGTRHP